MPVKAKCQTCGTLQPVSELVECDCGCGLICWDADACNRRWDEAVAAEQARAGEVTR